MKRTIKALVAVSAAIGLMLGMAACEPKELDTTSEAYAQKIRAMYEGSGEYANCPTATMETSVGTIKIRLFPNEAPKAVENFMTHAQNGYYDGLLFHRVIEDFMIQGGDPMGTGMGGESIWGEPFEIEYSQYLHFLRGSLAMANSGQLKSNGSQFFIVQGDTFAEDQAMSEQFGIPEAAQKMYEEFGGVSFLQYYVPNQRLGYTKFGYVFEGMEIVDKIAAMQVPDTETTSEPVKIVKLTVEGSFAPIAEQKDNTGTIVMVVLAIVVVAGVAGVVIWQQKKKNTKKDAQGKGKKDTKKRK